VLTRPALHSHNIPHLRRVDSCAVCVCVCVCGVVSTTIWMECPCGWRS
jgi:hypothetical protein